MFAPLSSSLHWLLRRGTRRDGGSVTRRITAYLQSAHGVFTNTREPGTRTPETGTTAECSSSFPRGTVREEWYDLTGRHLGSSFTEPGWSTGETETVGENGEPRAYAAYDDADRAWDRANSKKLGL